MKGNTSPEETGFLLDVVESFVGKIQFTAI